MAPSLTALPRSRQRLLELGLARRPVATLKRDLSAEDFEIKGERRVSWHLRSKPLGNLRGTLQLSSSHFKARQKVTLPQPQRVERRCRGQRRLNHRGDVIELALED